jgi:hypothetical protein
VGLKLNGTHQLLAYANDAHVLGDNIYTTNKNTGTLTDVSREVGPESNIEETKCTLVLFIQRICPSLSLLRIF